MTRARTISAKRTPRRLLVVGAAFYPASRPHWRPVTRAECEDMERPCPYVGCRYHLALDVHPGRDSIKFNAPDLKVWEMGETCALDVADRGGLTLEEIGVILGVGRERVRQIVEEALERVRRRRVIDEELAG